MSLGLRCRGTFGASLLLSFLISHSAWAQGSGTLKGTVYDKTSKDALPGAHVVIKGTSNGAATNLSGGYVLHKVPAGEYTVVASYIGYQSVSEVIKIADGETVTRDFSLVAETIEGEEVVVTAQAQGQLQAINQQIASDKIVNIVSEAKIQELPDFNAAQAISRLPGVTTTQSSGEANKVVIRGLAPQFNQVAVSGITLASTGSTQIGATSLGLTSGNINSDRSVDLSMVTPYMIKTISVYKSLTPDMNADAIGGRVDMELREAPDGLHADMMYQSGYTGKSKEWGNYRAVLSASNRFFDGDLGIYLLGNAEAYDRNSDNMTATYNLPDIYVRPDGYKAVQVSNVGLTRHIETRKRYGGNLILDYRLGENATLRSINLFARLESKTKDYTTTLRYSSFGSGNIDFTYRNGDSKTDMAVNTLEFEDDFGFMSTVIKIANTYSRNHMPSAPFYQFSQSGGISTGGANIKDVPPEKLISSVAYKGNTKTYLSNINLFSSDFKDNDQIYKADFKVPLALGADLSGFIKVGGEYRYNYRVNDQATPYLEMRRGGAPSISATIMDSLRANFPVYYDSSAARFPGSNFTNTDEDLNSPFLSDLYGGVLWIPDPGMINEMLTYTYSRPDFNAAEQDATNPGGWYDGGFQNLPNDYTYIERYYAGYAMGQLTFGPDFNVVGGARFEQVSSLFETYNLTDGRNPLTQQVFPITVYPENRFLLPMVQAKYNIFEWLDVRYSYTQTIARPDYHQLSPHITMSNDRLNVWAGNPDLQPAHSFNHDLQFTYHDNKWGLFSVGGFYKTVREFTYYTTYKLHMSYDPVTRTYYNIPAGLDSVGSYQIGGTQPNNGANLYTYINSPYDASIKGIETDLQMRFWYLPAPLNGIVLGVNYTHIWSDATYPWHDDRTTTDPVTRRTTVTTIDSTRTGRLIWQPNDVVNAYFGYDFKGFSGRISFLFQGNSVNAIGNYAEQDGFSRDYFRVDASARQMLPIEGLQLFLDLFNLNSRKNQAAQASIGAFTNEQNYGFTANLGVRYTLQ